MSAQAPSFAIVGAVNHGKSSVVAALAEDDDVRVSPMPGETTTNRAFGLRDLLVLIDTPGFQNARKALAEIERLSDGSAPLQPFAAFIAAHRHDAAFDAECRLLQPIVDGAGIIYVVDGSRPLRDIHRCEMEILRRTGAPRLAVVNRTGDDDHVGAWKDLLDQHFNIVRTFDAQRATFADRKDLIEALAMIERDWKDRLIQAVALMEAERDARIAEAGTLLCEGLPDVLRHAERATVSASAIDRERAALVDDLKHRYMTAIGRKERETHRALVALYAHRHVDPGRLPHRLFRDGLFDEETWRLFGLGPRQLVALSAVAGGVAGAGVDAATLGHSLGVGAALGAAVAGGSAWALGKRRPELSIDWPGVARWLPAGALRFAGGEIAVGPFKAENFPWILLDRALCVFAFADARSHARRDEAVVDVDALLPRLDAARLSVAHWPDDARRDCHRVFRTIRAGRQPSPDQAAAMRRAVTDALRRIADAEGALDRPAADPTKALARGRPPTDDEGPPSFLGSS